MNTLWVKVAACGALFGLAACSDGGGNDRQNGQPGTPAATIQSRFGPTFANAFNAGANTDPIDPQPGDLPPVSFTTDPIDF